MSWAKCELAAILKQPALITYPICKDGFAYLAPGKWWLHLWTPLYSTVQTTLDNTVPLSEVFFPSVVVCNINQIRKSFFEELGFYENDTLVRIMYEDFIKGTMDADWEASKVTKDPKRNAFYEVRTTFFRY